MSIGQAGGGAPSHPTKCETCGEPLGARPFRVRPNEYPKADHLDCLGETKRAPVPLAWDSTPTSPAPELRERKPKVPVH